MYVVLDGKFLGRLASVYLVFNKKNRIMIRMYFFIHIFMVGFCGNRIYQMKEKIICYIMAYGCYGIFYSLEYLIF